MKYSEFLKIIKDNITEKTYFLCHVSFDVMTDYPQITREHFIKFKKSINRILLRETKKIPKDSPYYGYKPSTLHKYLSRHYGMDYDRVLSRKHLMQKLISYHKKRGN